MIRKTSNVNKYHTLTPAYGREYNNKASLEKDLRSGKDFIYASPASKYQFNSSESLPPMLACKGAYCSVRDFREGDELFVYYTTEAVKFSLFTLTEDGGLA